MLVLIYYLADIPMFGANDNPNDNNTFSVGHLETIKPSAHTQAQE